MAQNRVSEANHISVLTDDSIGSGYINHDNTDFCNEGDHEVPKAT